jgi:hypothetical protein
MEDFRLGLAFGTSIGLSSGFGVRALLPNVQLSNVHLDQRLEAAGAAIKCSLEAIVPGLPTYSQ